MNLARRSPDEHVARRPGFWLLAFVAASVALSALFWMTDQQTPVQVGVVAGTGLTAWAFVAAKGNELFLSRGSDLTARSGTWFGVWAVLAALSALIEHAVFDVELVWAPFLGVFSGALVTVALFLAVGLVRLLTT